jgi:GT2 family glycosyltransferase
VSRVGCVVLTRGGRPESLTRAIESVRMQTDVDVDLIVVGNGWTPTGLPGGVRSVELVVNRGIPAGRNAGVPHVSGDAVLFLDDDAALASADFLARGMALFAAERDLGIIQPRPVDPVTGETPRSFVPRLRVGDPARDSDVTALWEGTLLVRREVLDKIGGWSEEYEYMHEGVDLAWRVIDAGYRVRYVGELHTFHDAKQPGRAPEYYWMQARNRVWLARRNLPIPLAVGYLTTWFLLTLLRVRGWEGRRQALAGWWHGFRDPCGPRRPISWRAAWRMTRAGRPPLI